MHDTEGGLGLLGQGNAAVGGRHAVIVGDRGSPGSGDLVHHLIGGLGQDVVDHHLGTPGGQQQGVSPAQALARAGDNRRPALKAKRR